MKASEELNRRSGRSTKSRINRSKQTPFLSTFYPSRDYSQASFTAWELKLNLIVNIVCIAKQYAMNSASLACNAIIRIGRCPIKNFNHPWEEVDINTRVL